MSFFVLVTVQAEAALSLGQVRKLIAEAPGFRLKSGAVRVLKVSTVDASTAEATAEVSLAFRLEKNDLEQWRVAEFRTGQDTWEDLEFVFRAVKGETDNHSCDSAAQLVAEKSLADPGTRRARCLLAHLLSVQLPSDAVRIKNVSSLSLPFDSHPSALVEAVVQADFRLTRSQKGPWRVKSVKTGTRDWADLDAIAARVNAQKVASARADLESIAKALEQFRAKRGFYVETRSEAVLIDFLSPVFLSRVLRLDPWHYPYHYDGSRDHFTLSSSGPDRKENTSDDILLSGSAK